jgi:hypothetical protein
MLESTYGTRDTGTGHGHGTRARDTGTGHGTSGIRDSVDFFKETKKLFALLLSMCYNHVMPDLNFMENNPGNVRRNAILRVYFRE